MNILVGISKAPDTTSKIAFKDGNTQFDEAGIQFIVNPYDEWYALVRAIELKEANGGKVTIITVGGAENDPIIRKALAIGADEAVRIDAEPTDALFVAQQIGGYAKDKGYDLILVGKETINYNGGQVGAMVAEVLDLPYIAHAVKLDSAGGTHTIERDVKGGTEVLEVVGACVLSAAKGMAEQRIPNMRGIMAARTKPLNVEAAVDASKPTGVAQFDLPPAKGDCKMIDADNAAELISLLHSEAKAI